MALMTFFSMSCVSMINMELIHVVSFPKKKEQIVQITFLVFLLFRVTKNQVLAIS